MGSLKSVKDVPGIDYYEYRDIDFFKKYKYRARVRLHGLGLTYYANTIDEFNKRLSHVNMRYRRYSKDEVKNNIHLIEKFIAFKVSVKDSDQFTIRLEGDTAGIFSNDLSKLLELKNISGLDVDISEAVTSSYAGVKYFIREPKHKYRIYFRSVAVEPSFITDLKEILHKNNKLYPSKGLTAWLYKTRSASYYYYRFCSSSFSIDYDDESTGTYLALMLGDKVGHRYKLEKHPDPI